MTVTYPKGGEIFHQGDTITIKWEATDLPKNIPPTLVTSFIIYYEYSDGRTGKEILELGSFSDAGTYKWIIPSTIVTKGSQDTIRIACDENGDYIEAIGKSGYFTIAK